MKILIAAACPDNRNLGVPGVMHSLADEFRRAGHQVRTRFQRHPGRLSQMLFGIRLASSADALWADVVDVHAVDAWPLCVLPRRCVVVARSHGLEVVQHRLRMQRVSRGEVSVGRMYRHYRGSLRLSMEKVAIRSSDAGLLLNDGDLQIARQEFRAEERRTILVRNGFPAGFLDTPIADASLPGIAVVGTWSHRKGADVVADVLSRLLQERSCKILLAGTGVPSTAVLDAFPPAIRDRVMVLERFDRMELPQILSGYQILLFPSRSEGYPLSLVEAMACGLAPVASMIPGVVELVESGRNGLVCPPGDSDAFITALRRMLDDTELAMSCRRAARERVASDSWKALADDTLRLYASLLRRRSSQSDENV